MVLSTTAPALSSLSVNASVKMSTRNGAVQSNKEMTFTIVFHDERLKIESIRLSLRNIFFEFSAFLSCPLFVSYSYIKSNITYNPSYCRYMSMTLKLRNGNNILPYNYFYMNPKRLIDSNTWALLNFSFWNCKMFCGMVFQLLSYISIWFIKAWCKVFLPHIGMLGMLSFSPVKVLKTFPQ